MVNFLFEKFFFYMCICVPKFVRMRAWISLLLNVSSFVYVKLLACTRIHMFACILVCNFSYVHIFLLSVNGNGWDKGIECEVVKVDNEEVGNGLLQSPRLSLLILSNFLIAKGLFDVNMKCLFCGEFCRLKMRIKIKFIITLLLF